MAESFITNRYRHTVRFDLYTITQLEHWCNDHKVDSTDYIVDAVSMRLEQDKLQANGGEKTPSISLSRKAQDIKERNAIIDKLSGMRDYMSESDFIDCCNESQITQDDIERYENANQKRVPKQHQCAWFIKGLLKSVGGSSEKSWILDKCKEMGFTGSCVDRALKMVSTYEFQERDTVRTLIP